MENKNLVLNPKDVKLKDLLDLYIDESNQDIVDSITNTQKVQVITKYRNMLVNIKNVCEARNKF